MFFLMYRSGLTQDIVNGSKGCAKPAADGMNTDLPDPKITSVTGLAFIA